MKRATGVALSGAALILAAFAFDASLLFVPGVAFVLLGILTPPWILLASLGASVTRELGTDRVIEDQALEARIHVRRGPLGLPGGEIVDPLAGGTVSLGSSHPGLRASRSTDVRVVARFPRRGRRRLEPPVLTVSDPFGLVRFRCSSASASQALLVLPRTERLRWLRPDGGERLDRPAGAPSPEMLAATEVDGLRPYRPGTPASRISWPALARGAGLLERRLQAERDSGPIVVLDVRCAEHPERVDAAVRAAASLALTLARQTGCDLLLPGDRRPVLIDPDLGAWPGAHARLALIEGGPEAAAPMLDARPRSGTVFLVSAQNDRVPARLLRASRRSTVLVLPAELRPAHRAFPSFEVSGCRGYLLTGGQVSDSAQRAA